MAERTDAVLVELSRQGDKGAFGELVGRYQALAMTMARRLVSQEACAQELVQDALLQAYLSLAQLRDPERFRSWLCGIVLNVCRGYLRDQKAVFFSLESLAGGMQLDAAGWSEGDSSPEQLAEEKELHQVVLQAVKALTPSEREITLSFYYDQLTAQEIANLLNISVGAVKVRLYRARRHLKDRLLSEYTDLFRFETRRKKMVKVQVMDVVKREFKDKNGKTTQMYVVIMLDEAGQRVMPVWVGSFEGQTIAMEIGHMATPRPLTFYFMAGLLKAIQAEVEEVRIESLKDNTFYGIVKIKCGSSLREVDARPSDAIALALVTGSPILAAEDVLAAASINIPGEAATRIPQSGIERILEEIKAAQLPAIFPKNRLSESEQHQANQKFVRELFGVK